MSRSKTASDEVIIVQSPRNTQSGGGSRSHRSSASGLHSSRGDGLIVNGELCDDPVS